MKTEIFSTDCVMPLIHAGYKVLTAVDSLEAQYLCELYPRPIHLVMVDIPLEPISDQSHGA